MPNSDAGLRRAIRVAEHMVIDQGDSWWSEGLLPAHHRFRGGGVSEMVHLTAEGHKV